MNGICGWDHVEFIEIAAGRYEFIAATCSVTALTGMSEKPRKGVSIAVMSTVIAKRGAAAQ